MEPDVRAEYAPTERYPNQQKEIQHETQHLVIRRIDPQRSGFRR